MKMWLKVVGLLALEALAIRSWANSPEASPLPAVETVVERAFARAQKELANDEAFKANYCYTRSKTTEFRNIRGNLTKRKAKTTANEPSTRRISEKPDTALSNAWAGTNTVSGDATQHKRDLLSNTNLMKRYVFELRGREVIDGRSTLIVDFKPASQKFSTSTLKERCLSKVAGRVWVDEEEYVLVKAKAHLTEGIGVVGGLVGAVHKFNFSFERASTEDGLWYTRLLTWHLEAREVIVERVIDCVETKTDVRKAR